MCSTYIFLCKNVDDDDYDVFRLSFSWFNSSTIRFGLVGLVCSNGPIFISFRNKIKLMAISGLLASEISSRFVDDDDDGSASVCMISVVNVLACLLACVFFVFEKKQQFFFSSSTFGVPIGTEQNQPTNQPTWPKNKCESH